MRLEEALCALPAIVPGDVGRLREHIDATWIEEALAATGTATLRKRRLPAQHVVWLIIGIALMRNESIERVVAMLDLALPSTSGPVAKSAITQARQRLGEEPLAYLFMMLAEAWAKASADRHRYRGLALYGVDGSTLRVADSPENRAKFGGQSAGEKRGDSGYPMVRMLALMALRSHLLLAFRFADYATGELSLAEDLWRELPDHSLTLVDRGFLVAETLCALVASGENRHWLTRAKSTTRIRRVKKLGRNDDLAEIELSSQTRRVSPSVPAVWIVRALKYQRKGFRPSVLLTSLLDPLAYPADELVQLYHERWELEIGYDEMKTHQLDRQETIRSRTPAGVAQELYGIAIAYNLVRVEMERAADEAGVAPTRLSFVNALALIRYALIASSTPPLAPSVIPRRLLDMRTQMKLLLLPERRERAYPRAVKIKMSNYNRKRPPTRVGAK
jgi:hypothetical protein